MYVILYYLLFSVRMSSIYVFQINYINIISVPFVYCSKTWLSKTRHNTHVRWAEAMYNITINRIYYYITTSRQKTVSRQLRLISRGLFLRPEIYSTREKREIASRRYRNLNIFLVFSDRRIHTSLSNIIIQFLWPD